jgi:hypothetical protein
MRAFPIWTGGVPAGAVMIVSQESDSLVVGAVIQDPQFRKRCCVGHLAAEGRDVLILNGRIDAVAIQDRFAMPHFVEGGMLKYFSHGLITGILPSRPARGQSSWREENDFARWRPG